MEKRFQCVIFDSYSTYVSCCYYLFQPLQNLSSSFPGLKTLPRMNLGQSIGLITEAWYARN